jgi:hypothetical protein
MKRFELIIDWKTWKNQKGINLWIYQNHPTNGIQTRGWIRSLTWFITLHK